jgi:hypothetical protein
MSPHEMTSARIEEIIQGLDEDLANPNYTGPRWEDNRRYWEGRREQYAKLLKERAEAGTYDTAGVVDQHARAYR